MKKTKSESATYKVKITKPVAGKFLLSYNIGQIVSVESKLADELVENGYAEIVE